MQSINGLNYAYTLVRTPLTTYEQREERKKAFTYWVRQKSAGIGLILLSIILSFVSSELILCMIIIGLIGLAALVTKVDQD